MRDDIEAVFVGQKLTAGGAVKKLEKRLADNERVLLVAGCNHSAGPGVVAVTDRRVLLVSSSLGIAKVIDLPLDQITSVAPSGGVMSASIKITAAKRRAKIKSVTNKVAEAISIAISDARAGAGAAQGGGASSTADELAKFHGLLRSGAISQAEFDAKKSELL
jgi:Ni,Fe-hydrogenase maturation factor